jgi:hypothetical protein
VFLLTERGFWQKNKNNKSIETNNACITTDVVGFVGSATTLLAASAFLTHFLAIHIVDILLQHFTPTFQILRLLVGATDAVLIHMDKLDLKTGRVIAFLIQYGIHHAAETMDNHRLSLAKSNGLTGFSLLASR